MSSQRFQALDVFRGLTICFMIIVNTGGDEYTFAPLLHANWHGFTPTDLVFPSFLFAVGNAMSFVLPKWESLPTSKVVLKILKRTFLIFLLGFLMYWFPFVDHTANGWVFRPFDHTRILGVLQRIGLCYGIASLMVYFLKPKWVFGITLFILVAYKWVMSAYGDFTLEGNAALKFDLWLMGPNHLYHGEGIAFDPEGVLSTFPAIGNVVFGYFAGIYIQQKGKSFEGLTHLLLAGAACITLAYFWDSSFPINKKLWTSSFVLYTVGIDLMIISAIIYLVDIRQKNKYAWFFETVGKNPLFIYLLSEVGVILMWTIKVGDVPLYRWIFLNVFSYLGHYWASLAFALWWMLTCWLAGWWMDKKKWYVRV